METEPESPQSRVTPGSELPGVAARLLEAATAEFIAEGFAGASIARITKRASCNVRMIYHYYGNKDGLYQACLAQSYERLRAAEQAATFWELPPDQAIRGLISFTFDYMSANPDFQGMMRIENMSGGQHITELSQVNRRAVEMLSRISEVLARGFRSGVFTQLPDAGDFYLCMLGLCTIHQKNRHTMGMVLGRDLTSDIWQAGHRARICAILLAWLQQRS